MIKFRKSHAVIRGKTTPSSCGFQDISFHGYAPNQDRLVEDNRYVGVMFAGRQNGEDDIIYVGINAYWETAYVVLPSLPPTRCWRTAVNTADHDGNGYYEGDQMPVVQNDRTVFGARSLQIFIATRKQ